MNNEIELQEQIVKMLRTVYDPEIPANIYELGLIYKIEVEGTTAHIDMTLTAPNCPAADFIIEDASSIIKSAAGQLGAVSVISICAVVPSTSIL